MLIICGLLCITCILILITLYYEVYRPTWNARNAAKTGGHYATPEEIDQLFFASDPFIATEIQGQLDTDAIRN